MRPASDLPSLSKRLERQNSLPAADPSSLTDDPAVDPGPKRGTASYNRKACAASRAAVASGTGGWRTARATRADGRVGGPRPRRRQHSRESLLRRRRGRPRRRGGCGGARPRRLTGEEVGKGFGDLRSAVVVVAILGKRLSAVVQPARGRGGASARLEVGGRENVCAGRRRRGELLALAQQRPPRVAQARVVANPDAVEGDAELRAPLAAARLVIALMNTQHLVDAELRASARCSARAAPPPPRRRPPPPARLRFARAPPPRAPSPRFVRAPPPRTQTSAPCTRPPQSSAPWGGAVPKHRPRPPRRRRVPASCSRPWRSAAARSLPPKPRRGGGRGRRAAPRAPCSSRRAT
mmetsp:Transcript_27136/g.79232  ORF Transcript_27136/g.79232 Transcript_27136/m.79232 type:complete len:351 (-) Transcript_27136:374-1426(-)